MCKNIIHRDFSLDLILKIYDKRLEDSVIIIRGDLFMKKRIISILLSTVSIFSLLSGCAKTETPKSSEAANTTASIETSQTASTGSGEKVEIEVFGQKPEAKEVMTKLIKKFEDENPNIKINYSVPPDSKTVLITRIATNEMPDILNSFPAEDFYKNFFDEGLLLDLTNEPFINNVSDSMLSLSAYNGKQFALPMTLSAYGIYYRTDIFEKYNITPPKTYPELIEVCKQLKAAGITPFTFGDKNVGGIAQRQERLIGVINKDSSTEFKKIATDDLNDSPTLRKFGEVLLELEEYGPADSLAIDDPTATSQIVNGEVAMLISGTWMLKTMQTGDPNIKVSLIPFPNPVGETEIPINIDTSYSISSSTKHKPEALAFLNFLSQTENAQIYCDAEGTPNMIKGVVYDVPQFSLIKEMMDNNQDFLTQVNIWPEGLREEFKVPAQQLIIDKNLQQYLDSCIVGVKKLYK